MSLAANPPVTQVTPNDALAFCKWLGEQDKRVYRLPTEAEWEYACRAGSRGRFSFGDDEEELRQYAWFSANAGYKPQSVGTKKPNAWGLLDMHGNVREWCADYFASDAYEKSQDDDPRGPASGSRVVQRGGCYWSHPLVCRSADRQNDPPDKRRDAYGFRVVCEIEDGNGVSKR